MEAIAAAPIASDAFRLRGHDVSRIEAFFDAAFAFAVTLMVVSLQVPATFDELANALRGVPAFAICFVMLWQVWLAHYTFCRRYGLVDQMTILLNCALVFLLLVYIFPLKFLCLVALEAMTGFGPVAPIPFFERCPPDKLDSLFLLYGVGFALVWGLLSSLYLHAWRERNSLGLTPVEMNRTLESASRFGGYAAVGGLSCVVAMTFADEQRVVLAGWCYGAIGVVEFFVAWRFGVARDRLLRPAPAQDAPTR